MILSTSPSRAAPAEIVWRGKCRIGYLCPSARGAEWHWELCLVSEKSRGHPRGLGKDRDAALEALRERFAAWCRAAELEPGGSHE